MQIFAVNIKKDVKILFFSRKIELKKYMPIANIVRFFMNEIDAVIFIYCMFNFYT